MLIISDQNKKITKSNQTQPISRCVKSASTQVQHGMAGFILSETQACSSAPTHALSSGKKSVHTSTRVGPCLVPNFQIPKFFSGTRMET